MHRRLATFVVPLVLAASGCGSCGKKGDAAPAASTRPLLDLDARLVTGHGGSAGRLQFEVPVLAGDSLVVEVTTTGFDPVLEVTPPSAPPLRNDDDQGSRVKSRVAVRVPNGGSMRIVVTSYDVGASGPCHVTVRRDGTARPGSAGSTLLSVGETRDGSLGPGDATSNDGRFVDLWAVDGPERGALELRLSTQGSVVPLAVVLDPNGRSLASSGRGTYVLTQPGSHRVQLSSPSRGQRATYRIALANASGGATASLARSHHRLPTTPGTPITVGQDQKGSLGASSARLPTGEPADVYALVGTAGQALELDLASDDFDAYLMVIGPNGRLFEDDDSNGTKNSHLSLTLPEAGTYRIVATAFRSDMQGGYALTFGSTALVDSSPSDTVGTAGNAPIAGELADGDETLRSGEYYDRYRHTFTPGSSVRIRLESNDFDPYLIMRTPSGEQLDNDDVERGERAAGFDIPSAENGEYTLLATTYQPGERGRYTLSFGQGAAVARPSSGGEGTSTGGTGDGGSHVYGLFAGISDYPGSENDLEDCANDAIKLAEAFRRSGLNSAERQIVLTDGQVTVDAIRSAMQRMARDLGPDDVFVFFYSGHGAQQENSRDVREIDGIDEQLYLYDGPLVDDELGQLFDRLRSQVSVVALDSCFSGGFAKDVITRPGRVGFFSSEEDVESAVASQFQAGGYLSYFMRTGISGEADVNPHDSVLTVGELEHFLYTQFGRHAGDVELEGAYQHLVVDRGAVRVSQVLWSYR
ncbi:MAG: caspase family protein [Polyangiales bacterium]